MQSMTRATIDLLNRALSAFLFVCVEFLTRDGPNLICLSRILFFAYRLVHVKKKNFYPRRMPLSGPIQG